MNYFQPYPRRFKKLTLRMGVQRCAAEREPSLRQLLGSRREQFFLFHNYLSSTQAVAARRRRELQRCFVRSSEVFGLIDECVPAGSNLATTSNLARSLAGIALLITLKGFAGAAKITSRILPRIDGADGRSSLRSRSFYRQQRCGDACGLRSGNGADTIVMPGKSRTRSTTFLLVATGQPDCR